MDHTGFYQRPCSHRDDDDDTDANSHGQTRYFPDTYLDSPILIHKRTKWLAGLMVEPPQGQRMQKIDYIMRDARRAGANLRDFEIVDPDEYPKHYRFAWPGTADVEFEQAKAIASDVFSSVKTSMKERTGVSMPFVPSVTTPEVAYWLARWSYFDSLVEEFSRVQTMHGSSVSVINLGHHTRVIATQDVWFLACKGIGSFMYTYEQVLMLKDLMYSRAQSYIAASVFYPGDADLVRLISETCLWHEKCLTRHGNKGFEILKQTEALSKAYLSEMTDTVFGNDGPFPRMVEKVRDKERKYCVTSGFLADEFSKVLASAPSVQHVVEIYGLLKISGHPLIDPLIGGLSAAEEARAPDHTSYVDAHMINWEFKRNMLMNYIKKHGSWPPLHFTPEGKKTVLHERYRRQNRGLNRQSYPLSDWQHCRFGKIVELDEGANYMDYLDDKSISLYRTNVAAFWDKDVKPKSQRRLLLELIERERLCLKDIITLVMRREVPFDWLIVSIHPKEREFKLAPRMFSMLVFEIRCFFALTEANLADHIFPYLPQSTMTLSKNAISRHFLQLTQPLTSQDALKMFVEVDLSRWNLRWRAAAVDPVGQTLNDMFGVVGVFDYCHTFFSSAMVMVRVSDLRPNGIELDHPPESELVWYNHLGGFEGICQKLWTICTYSMISLAINDLPLAFTLVGQADNQVLSIIVARVAGLTDAEILRPLRDKVVSRVADQCAKVNQEVKPEECLESTTVITYSKDVYVQGVYRPTTLKFHSRLFPHSSAIFPSIRTNLGAIFSTAVAGAEKSAQPMLSYFLACLYGSLYLLRCMKKRGPYGVQMAHFKDRLGDRCDEFIKFMITLPSEAGGFPVIPFVGFTYKGGSDPLGKSLSAMHCLGLNSGNRLYNRMLAQMSDPKIYNPTPDIRVLFMDPFGIPIKKPVTSTDGVATETMDAIKLHVKTLDLKELMSSDTTSYVDKIVEVMSKCRPMNPLIMRDILDCSVAGITDTVSKMFVATRTLQHVVRSMGVPVIDKVLHLESSGLLYMYNRFATLPTDPAAVVSIFDLTTACRNRWYPNQESPIVGLTTYQPLDFQVRFGREGMEQEGVNAVLVTDSDPFETRGKYDPYVGSKTREKRSEHGFKIVGTDSSSRAMRKLQLIASQTGNDVIFKSLLDVVGWSRTNTKLSDHSDVLPGASGGTLSHRYAARAGHQDAFNIGSPNFATHCCVSTDNTGYLSGGVYDYPLMFQEFILFALWILMTTQRERAGSFGAVTIVTQGTKLAPLPSVAIVGPDTLSLPVLRFPTNNLVFIPQLRLEHVSGAITHPALPITSDFTPTKDLRRMTIEAFFRTALRKHSMGRQIADGSKQHFQGTTMDIAEVKANGLWLIAHCIKNVIVDEAISNFMMTDLRDMKRWKVMSYAAKLISPLCLAVTPQVGHPMLSDDPTVIKFSLYDKPSYAGGEHASHDRFCAIVNKLVVHTLSGNDTAYNHRRIGIFTSDNSRILSETLLQCLLCDLYVWIKTGVIDRALMNIALGNKLIPNIRSLHDEKPRVSMIVRSGINIAALVRAEHPGAAEVAARLGRGRVVGYKSTIEDMMKSTRDLNRWGLHIPSKPARKVLRLDGRNLPTSDDWAPSPAAEVMEGTRVLDVSRSSPDSILSEVYFRNSGRIGYYSGTVLYTWSAFASILSRKSLIVIGSGMGAAARVAIDNGCPHVFGLDLRNSLPMKSHRFRFYKPPMVMGSEYSDRYTQMSESFTTSGDWLNPTVVNAVTFYDAGDSTLLIDVQDNKQRFGLETLRHIIKVKKYGVIMLRAYLAYDEHKALCADLSASGMTFRSYTMEATGSASPVIFILTKWSQQLVMNITPGGSLTRNPVPLEYLDDADQFERSTAFADALLNMYMPSASDTPEQVRERLRMIMSESSGDYDTRYAYSHWTRILRAYTSAVFMCVDRDRQLDTLLQWYFAGFVIHTEGLTEPLYVKVDWSLCYHLASSASKI